MENTYRDVNIAAANEFSRLADRFGVNVWEAISLANLHPRVNILRPGPGVGGHCIGVDPWFLVEAAPDLAALIKSARRVNDSQPQFVVDLISRGLDGLKGKQIALLGLAYKADVDDLRESPAFTVAELLQAAGASVKAYEPLKEKARIKNLETCSLEDALQNADAIALLVAHTPLKELDPQNIAALTPARIAFDAVNGWPQHAWEEAGFNVFRLGDGRVWPVREARVP
jgi:UDP-N-acetyl-D-mannosaminuronic acid dehydrogenase